MPDGRLQRTREAYRDPADHRLDCAHHRVTYDVSICGVRCLDCGRVTLDDRDYDNRGRSRSLGVSILSA
jgi:hypothetical protein